MGLLLAVDPILDMGRTAVNVAGQARPHTIVARREGLLDLALYNAERTGDPFVDDSSATPWTPSRVDVMTTGLLTGTQPPPHRITLRR